MKKLIDPLPIRRPAQSTNLLASGNMILLIKQDRPADQKQNAFYFILGEQWSNLMVHDMRTVMVNAGLENHRSQTTPGTPMSHFNPLHLLHL